MDPPIRIRIHTKMSRIRNTAFHETGSFLNVSRSLACNPLLSVTGVHQDQMVQHEAPAVQTAVLHPTKNLEALEDPAILVLKRTSESSIPDTDCLGSSHVTTSSLIDENSNVITTTKKTPLRRPFSRHVHKSRIFYSTGQPLAEN
jgi:hypothetical protein